MNRDKKTYPDERLIARNLFIDSANLEIKSDKKHVRYDILVPYIEMGGKSIITFNINVSEVFLLKYLYHFNVTADSFLNFSKILGYTSIKHYKLPSTADDIDRE